MDQNLPSVMDTWAITTLPCGKSINELLHVDGHPLWWFYKRLVEIKFIPFQPSLHELYEQFKEGIPPKTHTLQSKMFRQYIMQSENVKRSLYNKKSHWKGEKNSILFLSYLNHLRGSSDTLSYFRIENVLSQIKKDEKLHAEVIVIDEFSHRNKQQEAGINTVYPFMTKEVREEASKVAKELSHVWKGISETEKGTLFMIDQKSIWKYLKPYINFYFSQEMMYITSLYYFTFKKIIQEQEVRGTYTSAISSLYEKCLIAAASTCKIPSFMAMHGIGTEFKKNKTNELHSMNFLVIGEKYKEDLIESGISEKNISVTGPMIFDELIPFMNTESTPEEKFILLTTSPFAEDHFLSKEEYFARIETIFTQMKESTSMNIVVKLHPREKYHEEYQRIAEKIGLFNITVLTESTRKKHYELIQQTELLINFGSTTALEAMILHKPTLTINLFDRYDIPINTFILKSPATIKVQWDEDITIAIARLLAEPTLLEDQVELFVEQHCYKVDGKTQERVVDVIKKSISHDKTEGQQNHESSDKSELHPSL